MTFHLGEPGKRGPPGRKGLQGNPGIPGEWIWIFFLTFFYFPLSVLTSPDDIVIQSHQAICTYMYKMHVRGRLEAIGLYN